MQDKSKKINWMNTAFVIVTPLVGGIGTLLLCHFGMVKWQTWLLAAVYGFLTTLAISAGYHRLFAHRAYKAAPIVRYIFATLGAGCAGGSVLEWATDHRNHHRYAETDKDPYSISHGFWYAHVGWVLYVDDKKRDYSNVDDLSSSAFLRFQHKHFELMTTFMAFLLPAFIAALWGNLWAGFIVAGVLRVVITQHSIFLINSLCHWAGKQPYSEKLTARDHWVTALITMGEGFHNFHHQFPVDYRNGVRYFHYDPTKWLVYGLSKIGLTSHLKRISDHKILSFKIRLEENRLKMKHQQDTAFIDQKIEPLKAHMMTLIEKIAHLETDLAALKEEKLEYVKGRYQIYKQKLQTYLETIKVARKELNESLNNWRQLCVNV